MLAFTKLAKILKRKKLEYCKQTKPSKTANDLLTHSLWKKRKEKKLIKMIAIFPLLSYNSNLF